MQTTFDETSYSLAVQAHDQQWPVLVRGDLERHGQRWHLADAQFVSVGMVDDEDGNTNTGCDR
ncbi:hypothetical protein Thiowin_03054 [Thiorhodovibrio winogradskyi]|uniref:Uncharacterized protein n=1 Tax=Thiorhodovibrio winogradskyi TaxID=77007 RepID=A0ABZ0SAF6_9GAMM|nr:hypothetical protein [Thiorhodovibrio winogradskyi]